MKFLRAALLVFLLCLAPACANPLRSIEIRPVLPIGGLFTLGDSITYGYGVVDPAVNGYPARLSIAYRLPLHNLGLDGWTSGGVIANELPGVVSPCAMATLDIGTNDADGVQNRLETVPQYEQNVTYIVAALRSRCKSVVVLGLIENPYTYTNSTFQNAEVEMNAFLSSLPGVTFVGLNADPRLHNWAYFLFPGSLHPTAAGDAVIAQDIEARL